MFLAAPVPSWAAVAVRRRPVSAFRPAVEGRLTAGRALHQRHLVGGGPLLGPVGAGAVAGPLAVVEQVAAVGVLLHAEQLVLGVGEADAQRHAAVGHRDVLLHPDLPGALDSALVTVEDVEQGGGGQVHGGHSHVVHWRRRRRRDTRCVSGKVTIQTQPVSPNLHVSVLDTLESARSH